MRKRNLNIVLIIFTISLWAYIIFRIAVHSGKDKMETSLFLHEQNADTTGIKKDTITLFADYRDPFLDRKIQIRKENEPAKALQPVLAPAIPVWPEIKYSGMVSNAGKYPYAIINMNNRAELIAGGEEVDGIKVLFIHPDSVRLKYKNETKTFIKP